MEREQGRPLIDILTEEDSPMPRPKSDKCKYMFTVTPDTLAQLDRLARHHEWLTESGEPNRSMAVRKLADRAAKRIKDVGFVDSE